MKCKILSLFIFFICIYFSSKAATLHFISTADNINVFQPSICNHPLLSETIAIVTLAAKSEAISGELATITTAGFYRVSYLVVVTQQPSDGGLLSIKFSYTDAESGLEIITPKADIENINLLLTDPTNQLGLNSNFLLNIAAGSQVNYTVSYASSPNPEEDADNAMQYSVHMILEEL